jgi:hypothetical protein
MLAPPRPRFKVDVLGHLAHVHFGITRNPGETDAELRARCEGFLQNPCIGAGSSAAEGDPE